MILAGDFIPLKTQPMLSDLGDQLVLANLEGPICCDDITAVPKAGPSLFSLPFSLKGRWAFALANNHLMDYGEEGFRQTVSFLSDHGCPYAGAGINLDAARRPMMTEESGKRIAVFSCCEKQFGVAGINRCGVAEKGLWLLDEIDKVKKADADYVIVSCHAAAELSPFPSPRLQDFYRHLIDAGANVVQGHHSHVPQGWEAYHGGLIAYGLGNFIVDPKAGWKSNPNYLWSLIVHLNFSASKVEWRIEPFGRVPERAEEYIRLSNEAISHRELLEGVWQEIAIQLLKTDYSPLMRLPPYDCRHRKFIDAVRAYVCRFRDRVVGRAEDPLGATRLYWHYFACESHRDAIETALGVLSGVIEDRRTKESSRIVEQIGGVQEPLPSGTR